ncbi:ATP-binding protein, partial [Candidatus Micrarchaeota archaeon]|nr:ATP-binding protein [Candidatus Micrarchaeota archaeon]
ISQSHLERVLKSVKPSTGIAQLENYERFKMDFERRTGKEEEKKEMPVKWSDVAGLEDVKQALLETIELPLIHEEMIKEYGVKPNKGILLFGPPGTGKTLTVKAASNELNASFIDLNGAEIMKKGYYQAASIIKETFNRARENTPAIIFIDEIESVAPSRKVSSSGVLGQILTEMDGIKEAKGIVVIAATNKPSMLDPAILRPGRFDKIFYIPPPDEKTREEIFKINLGKFSEGIDISVLAENTEGFSGADISSIVQEIKMKMVREKLRGITPTIKNEDILKIISRRKPSISGELLMEYQKFLKKYGERR